MQSDLTIKRGIPCPPTHSTKIRYPFRKMEVGEMFFVRFSREDKAAVLNRVHVSAAQYSRNGKQFVTRCCTVDGLDGVGIWRVK